MPHPSMHNHTRYCVESLIMPGKDGVMVNSYIVKQRWLVSRDGRLREDESNPPTIELAGQFHGPPETSSYRYEPETAYTKPSTDIVLLGHAHPNRSSKTRVDVELRVGDIHKTVRVYGDRTWVKRLGVIDMTNPAPLDAPVPLIYERAFGGWDRAEPDPYASQFEPRNPVGVGFRRKEFEDGLPVPNLEDPRKPLLLYGDTPPPAGFGFIAPHWQPRARYAGTYDDAWQRNRAPLLPSNFDERFFNAASPGLVAPKYLQGNEAVSVENAHPEGRLAFQLPGLPHPRIDVHLRSAHHCLSTNLDTVIIDADALALVLLWRAYVPLPRGPHDVVAVEVFPS